MKKTKITLLIITLSTIIFGCKKDDPITTAPTQLTPAIGEYILSEGGFGGNNTKLSYYNNSTNTIIGDFFLQQNPTITGGLGDTGNDMIVYGSKLYIVLNVSGRVTVLNANNATFIKNISFIQGPINKSPRYAIAARGKVFVTAYDNKVSVIDTTLLTITNTIPVGPNPEGIAASENYLYVANSGGYNLIPDSTVSLIDLNTETEIKKIKVGVNPNKVQINQAGNIFVSAYGNFGSIAPSLSVINGNTNANGINLGPNYKYSHLRIFGDIAYCFNNYGGAGTAKVFNTATNVVLRNEFITDGTLITTPYGLDVDELNGDVYIADAGNYVSAGKITCFSSTGVKKFSFSVAPGVNPNKIVFRR
ncbi:MAG: YncE family protein [Ferruginibacter sp.]|nr:YncE family protein [Ferruginibacter sp.]